VCSIELVRHQHHLLPQARIRSPRQTYDRAREACQASLCPRALLVATHSQFFTRRVAIVAVHIGLRSWHVSSVFIGRGSAHSRSAPELAF
jgi:hypothetical protein